MDINAANISLNKVLSEEEIQILNEVPVDLGEKFDEIRNSIRDKLKKLGTQNKDLRFLAKPIYERKIQNSDKTQTAVIQEMIHAGPKEMYKKIHQESSAADIGVHEGYKITNPVIGEKWDQDKEGYENQNKYIFVNQGDIIADTTQTEELIQAKKQLSETELKILNLQEKIEDEYIKKFPNTYNQSIYKDVQASNTAENIEQIFWGKEHLGDSPFAADNIKHTAKLEGEQLKEVMKDIINQINLYVIGINEATKKSKIDALLQDYYSIYNTYITPLKYIWHRQDDTKKTDWLNKQILKFNDPLINIENIFWNQLTIEKRNNIAVSAISQIAEKHKEIHANYGGLHLTGMHDTMLQEGWTLKDIELMPIKYQPVSWWKRIGETIKKPFWKLKTRKERKELKKLLKQAKKENIEHQKPFNTQIEILDEKGRPKLVPFPEIETAPTKETTSSNNDPQTLEQESNQVA